ncbi:hypothetical protein [Bacteroides stercoris]|uniref:hypothetical protein n=1 Tax=Bacteroides stercoris TaxID=46506 RepID=UPI00321973C0
MRCLSGRLNKRGKRRKKRTKDGNRRLKAWKGTRKVSTHQVRKETRGRMRKERDAMRQLWAMQNRGS